MFPLSLTAEANQKSSPELLGFKVLASLRGILEFFFGGAHGFSTGLKKVSSCHDKRGIKISMHVFLLKPGS